MNEKNSQYLKLHQDILSFRDLSDRTVTVYISCLAQYIEWVEREIPMKDLADVSWEEIRSYIRFLRDVHGLNPRTVNVHIAQLRDFSLYVLHRDWDRYQVPFLHFDEALPRVPSKPEVVRLIDSIDNPKHKAEIALLYSSGIRVSELCGLRCGDIYRSRNAIHISKSKNRSERYAVLSKRVVPILADYIHSTYPDAAKDDWLFPGQKPGSHICKQTVANVLSARLEAIGLGDMGYTCHSLRHAFGLHLYEAGADIMAIKEAMGHKSLSSTAVYLTLGIGNGRSVSSPYDS